MTPESYLIDDTRLDIALVSEPEKVPPLRILLAVCPKTYRIRASVVCRDTALQRQAARRELLISLRKLGCSEES